MKEKGKQSFSEVNEGKQSKQSLQNSRLLSEEVKAANYEVCLKLRSSGIHTASGIVIPKNNIVWSKFSSP